MAYGFRNNATAVNDGGGTKKKIGGALINKPTPKQEEPKPQQNNNQGGGNVWNNVIDYSAANQWAEENKPSNYEPRESSYTPSNNMGTIGANNGNDYGRILDAQQAEQAERARRQEEMKRERDQAMEELRQQELARQEEMQRQNASALQEPERPKGGNMTVPEGYVTRPSSTNSVTAGATPSRDYTDEEIAQMQRDRGNLVVPRSYNPMDQSKENNAGLPSARDEDEDQLGAWRVLQNTPDSSDTPDNDWGQLIDNGSALAGTNYNAPYDFTRYQDYLSRGYSDDQAKDAARRDYSAPTTTKVQPNSAVENDFFYQLAISEGATPEEALEYMGEMYELADNAPTYNSFGDFIVNGVLNGAEGRERLADANQKVEDLYANIPDNPYLGNPDAAIDHYIENGGPERDAAFKAWYRNTRNDFETANQKNDVAQDYINAKMAMDGKTKADYSPKDWFKLEAEANAYAEEQVNTPSKTTPEYQLEQINNRRNQDNATLEDVVDQLETVGQNTPTTSEMEQVLDDLGINRPAGYMPYGDPRQGNNTGTGNGATNPSITSGNATPNASGGYNQNVVDYMNANGNGTPQNNTRPSSSGGGLLNDIVDFFTGNNYKYNEDGTVSKVEETPKTKQDRLDELNQYLSQNGYTPEAYNNYTSSGGGITDVIDDIMGGGSTTPTTTESGKRDWEKNPPKSRNEVMELYLERNGKDANDLTSEDLFEINTLWNNMYAPQTTGTGTTGSTGATAEKGKGTSSGSTPKGSETYRPSYGQGGQVVKAPYKTGGYTEQELMDMGNRAYGTAYGNNAYEGYYRAPDGHYYPVDQEKAEYYMRYGTYNGWEEPMRDYFNTFGTFSGYTPTWRSTGRNYGGGRSYSYSGGSRSSSGYYGGNNYSGNNNSNVQPELTNQTRQRINNIMRNWTF